MWTWCEVWTWNANHQLLQRKHYFDSKLSRSKSEEDKLFLKNSQHLQSKKQKQKKKEEAELLLKKNKNH